MNLFFKRYTILLLLISLFSVLLSCNQTSNSTIVNFYMYPNPSEAGREATFVIEFDKAYDGRIKLLVEDSESVNVFEYSKEFTGKESLNFNWAVQNGTGIKLTPGRYYATVRLYGTNTGERTFWILVN